MILAVGNIKGGVGKTMLAVNIAVGLAQRGRDVLVIDGDEQASAATFAQIRSDLSAVKLTTVQLTGKAIRQQMPQLVEKYSEIIVDVGGRDTGSLRAAMMVADAVLVPFQPRSVDLWAGVQMAALVREVRDDWNNRLRAYAVLNAADAQGRDNDDAMTALAAIEGMEALPVAVVRRKAFANAFSAGLSVLEQSPKDAKACGEILSVVNALYTQEVDNGH